MQDCAGPAVLLPKNQSIKSTKRGILNISKHLSTQVQTAMVLPGLQSASLISTGQLCGNNFRVVLNSKKLVAIKNNTIVIQGIRNQHNGLWDIPVAKTSITYHNFTIYVHHGIYPSSNLCKYARANVIQRSKPQATKNKIPKYMRGLHSLIENDRLDSILTEQLMRHTKIHPW